MRVKRFVTDESLLAIKSSTIKSIYLLTVFIFAFGLAGGLFITHFGYDFTIAFVRFFFAVFCLFIALMIGLSVWLFFLLKKNRVLKNDFLLFVFLSPLYILVLIGAISAIFTVSTTETGGISSLVFYPLFIMLPLGFVNLAFCYYAYLKPFVLLKEKREKEKP